MFFTHGAISQVSLFLSLLFLVLGLFFYNKSSGKKTLFILSLFVFVIFIVIILLHINHLKEIEEQIIGEYIFKESNPKYKGEVLNSLEELELNFNSDRSFLFVNEPSFAIGNKGTWKYFDDGDIGLLRLYFSKGEVLDIFPGSNEIILENLKFEDRSNILKSIKLEKR